MPPRVGIDWNDELREAKGDRHKLANLKRMFVESTIFDQNEEDNMTEKVENHHTKINALAKIDDPIEFDLGCKKLQKELKCALTAIKQSVAKRRLEADDKATVATTKADIKKLGNRPATSSKARTS
jgi:hypothetical protein